MGRSTMGIVSKFLGLQVTGGSSSTVDGFVKMREAGCVARLVLTQAAADRWGVDAKALKTENGTVVNPANGDSLTYGALADAAAKLSPPSDMALREPKDWKLLKKSVPRVEIREKVTGAPIFGIDVQMDDMLYGTVKMSPRFGVGAKSVNKDSALAVNGVRDVIEIEAATGKGFGVVADNTWAAFQGAEALEVEWEDAPYPAETAAMWPLFDQALDAEPSFTMADEGDVEDALANGDVFEAEYTAPFLAHTTLEPMNATAQFKDGKLEIWTGTQGPGFVEMLCAQQLNIESEDVTCHTTHLGGGFGRRATLAAKTGGRPIKMTYSREEDTRHDFYRPMAKGRYRAKLNGNKIEALQAKLASPSTIASMMGRYFPEMNPMGPDKSIVDGSFGEPLDCPNVQISGHVVNLPIPVGFWRSVGHSFNGYFYESLMDELAERADVDPLEFRLANMTDERFAPAIGVLKKVAEMSDWGSPVAPGKGRGIAHCLSFGTWVAQVIEIDVTEDEIKIEKVWCAADPGTVLNPEIFRDQMMSGIIYGLSAALSEEITFADGEVEQSNFHDFDAMRMYQTPEIEVSLLETSPKMGGAGEPGTPPSVPALANAIYAATGKRIREMPLSNSVDFV